MGRKNGYVLEIIKALCGLKTSTRQWSLCIGDALREMGFTPSRVDHNRWMKASRIHPYYDCIGTFADDLRVVAKQTLRHLEMLAIKLNLKKITDSPIFFGAD